MKLIKKILMMSLPAAIITVLYKRMKNIDMKIPYISNEQLNDFNFMKQFIYQASQEYVLIAHKKNDQCSLCDNIKDKHLIKINDVKFAHSMFTIGDVKNHTFIPTKQADVDVKDES